ncbi:mitochondrial protein Pet127-domain-containing protein [Phlebopus sp. FC_14]|nr:mitochondrial protein Pet127-domain-containing protein [Phlebopus sp. FC_14]
MNLLENGTARLALSIAGRRFAVQRTRMARTHTRMTDSSQKLGSDEVACTMTRASQRRRSSSASDTVPRPIRRSTAKGPPPPSVTRKTRVSDAASRRKKAAKVASKKNAQKPVVENEESTTSGSSGRPSTDVDELRVLGQGGVVGRAKAGKTVLRTHVAKAPSTSAAALQRSDELRNGVIDSLGSRRAHDMLAGETSSPKTPLSKKLVDGILERGSGFVPEHWSTGWGDDELTPSTFRENGDTEISQIPPHKFGLPPLRRAGGQIGGEQDCTSILQDIQSPSEHKPIARLAHGLDRVLFNPGVHWLQDPRSRVYNFNPWLESIPKVNDFAFDRISGFVKSSKDNDMQTLAKKHGRRFTGSTSSLTGLLSHIYFLISGDREVDTSTLSSWFVQEPTTFTPGQRMPTSVLLNYREGVWSIDADKADELAEKNVLTWMGTMLEKFLTVPESEFRTLLRSTIDFDEDRDTRREAYRYAMSDRFIMRSQLDCIDPRLPGTGVFDIKTRAAVPIRLDVLNYEENSGYLIKTLTGQLESFEKEYYDLIRSAFLKYSFQARIGNMDGVLVAYHNTARIFGFQYVPLTEMEARLFGPGNTTRLFNKCVQLLEVVLDDIVSIYGERSVRCTFETREKWDELNVWIEPADWDQAAEGQPCPITQLHVQVVTLVRDVTARRQLVVASNEPWTLQWTISQSAQPPDHIRANLAGAQRRQFRAMAFPSDVSTVQEMEARWQNMDFGGRRLQQTGDSHTGATPIPATLTTTAAPSFTPDGEGGEIGVSEEMEETTPGDGNQAPTPSSEFFRSMVFRRPDRTIERLRLLAREGRDETLRLQAELEGREKVVWGFESGSGEGDRSGSGSGDGIFGKVREEDERGGECASAPDGASDALTSSLTMEAAPDSTRKTHTGDAGSSS